MDRDAFEVGRIAVGQHRHHAVDEIAARRADRPAGPSAGDWAAAAASTVPGANKRRAVIALERAVVGGRAQPIEPAAPVFVARRGKGAARQLFGIKAEGGPLRAVAALGQRARRPLRFRNGRRSR